MVKSFVINKQAFKNNQNYKTNLKADEQIEIHRTYQMITTTPPFTHRFYVLNICWKRLKNSYTVKGFTLVCFFFSWKKFLRIHDCKTYLWLHSKYNCFSEYFSPSLTNKMLEIRLHACTTL